MVRSLLFSAVVAVAGLYALAYILLSMTPVQDKIRSIAETELSKFLGGQLTIQNLSIYPFNELVLNNVALSDPQGRKCIVAGKLGAGIDLWRFLRHGRIEVTYAELIDADVRLWQQTADSKINIQFLIDALAPKDKSKPPTKFDLKIRNIVVRRAALSYDKRWLVKNSDSRRIDFNHIRVENLSADAQLPELKNDDFTVDLRRLAFELPEKFTLENLSCKSRITNKSLTIQDLVVKLPGSDIRPSDIYLKFDSFKDIAAVIYTGDHEIELMENKVTPSDFSAFYPPLENFRTPVIITLDAGGNLTDINIRELTLRETGGGLYLNSGGLFRDVSKPNKLKADLKKFRLKASSEFIAKSMTAFPAVSKGVKDILSRVGDVNINLEGHADLEAGLFGVKGLLETSLGNLNLDTEASVSCNFHDIVASGKLSSDGIQLGKILNESKLGMIVLNMDGNLNLKGKDLNGKVALNVPTVEYNGGTITNISANAEKSGNLYNAHIFVDDPYCGVVFDGLMNLEGKDSHLIAQSELRHFTPSEFINVGKLNGYELNGKLEMDVTGDSADNLTGYVSLQDFSATGGSKGSVSLRNLNIQSNIEDDNYHELTLRSDFADIDIRGEFTPSAMPALMQGMLAQLQPELVNPPKSNWQTPANLKYLITVRDNSTLTEWLNLPVEWYNDVTISGEINGEPGSFTLATEIPYMVQGRDKLIRNTSLNIDIEEGGKRAQVIAGTTYPTKKGDLKLDIDLTQNGNQMLLTTWFNRSLNTSFNGSLQMGATVNRTLSGKNIEASLHIFPSSCFLNKAEWKIDSSDISYRDRIIEVKGFNVHHDNQFVNISGVAGPSADDAVKVGLANIDLSYIFDTLNINFVNFGGYASGEVEASQLLSGTPVAFTRKLMVKDLAYNGAVLGDGDISSHWDNNEKCITIDALIKEGKRQTVDMKGGIWATRDSLSFDFNTDKVNVAFLQPFMAAFADKFEGRASGRALLYGTFKDIDLKGRVFADTVSIKLGFTNVTYSGSDSVIIDPGHIHIPEFKLYDKYGHTAVLGGDLTHDYFHEPSFNFRLTKVENFLLYDTNPRLNPDWYGTIFGNGTGSIIGRPGYVSISADMTTQRNSTFTFVLNNRQDAGDYQFLTFSDKRKALEDAIRPKTEEEEFLERFKKKSAQQDGPPTIFEMDLRVQATPEAALTIVMDPAGGDKITARGNGNINIGYSSSDDEMTMFGKYTLDRGTYNFTLQDLILKDFTIKPGSSITFTGDPLDANLNISAAYRVNTNLTDLDKSFATDKELNRTNVPVDALLNVTGDMTRPNVTFDIDLPTLTEETARKVRSIISTEDMMSQQIIYLLALNRFYTPEYMGMSSNGGEWASVASSTLSSQLSNMLGQLTDKVNLMPSLRSDKGDFSDLEVDIALSSQLHNNRLLINGNFGYRDRSTSSTTFVGDFDIEYLLNANGNLRLKAYNHFNDQNYYLRSALTTQGLGIIYRKEFDNPFSFLRRRKSTPAPETADSISHN
ncbi:MAG: translocation/assembly module TamB [Muribaculum sp.]|nr:translocation/assembly module TamB [Muribaculum sp.]